MVRIQLEPAFVLHTRPYSNSSLIVELFTQQYGRVAALARSARGMSSRYKGKLQAFTPMLVSYSGRADLMSLGNVELNGPPYFLNGNALLCGFYLNEVLLRLLHRDDAHPYIYQNYQNTLEAFLKHSSLEVSLRRFEKELLYRLGYGFSFNKEADSGRPIDSSKDYYLHIERGFIGCDNSQSYQSVISGKILLAIANDQYDDPQVLQAAKKIMRAALARLLGDKPLKSRELF